MILYDLPLGIVLAYLFVFGTVAGSFLNVCIYRLPQRDTFWGSLRGLWSPPSRCPQCFRRISVRDNIPVIGWLKLRGRCRFCRAKISMRYPLIEFFNGLLFVVVYWLEVPSGWGTSIADSCVHISRLSPQGIVDSVWLSPIAVVHWRYAYHMVLLEALVVATFIDFDLKIIPDGVTVPGTIVGVLGGLLVGQVYLVPLWFQEPSVVHSLRAILPEWLSGLLSDRYLPGWFEHWPHAHGLAVSLAGLVIGGGVVWTVRVIGRWVLRQEAMGFGDVTLMAMIGSFLGWQPTLVIFFVAPVCALLVVLVSWAFRRQRVIPYGPYLSLATLIVILGWQKIWTVAERVFSLGPVLVFLALFMAGMLVVSLFVLQGVKRLLGIPLYPPEWVEEWTSADQLTFFQGENVDVYQGRWRASDWPGLPAGRGSLHEDRWRRETSHR